MCIVHKTNDKISYKKKIGLIVHFTVLLARRRHPAFCMIFLFYIIKFSRDKMHFIYNITESQMQQVYIYKYT